MLHHEQGNAPGIATPIRKTVNALASKLTVSQYKQHSDFTADGDISATGEASQLRHLQRQYERAGLNLYPLDGDSLLVVQPALRHEPSHERHEGSIALSATDRRCSMSFNRDLLPDPATYFENHGHSLFRKTAKGFRTDCTIHGGTNPNLSVARDSGAFFCFSCGAKGGNVLDYEMQATGCDFVTAAKTLNAWVDDDKPSDYKPSRVNARDLLQVLATETNIAAMTVADVAAGKPISDPDKDRFLVSVAPAQGAQLITAIGTLAKVIEIDELSQRISKLEEHHAKP